MSTKAAAMQLALTWLGSDTISHDVVGLILARERKRVSPPGVGATSNSPNRAFSRWMASGIDSTRGT